MEDKEYKGLYDFLENAPEPTETDGGNMEVFKKFFKRIWMDRVNPQNPPKNNRLYIKEGETLDGGWMFMAVYNGNIIGRRFLRFIIKNGAKIDKIVYNDIEVKYSEKKRFLNEVLFDEEE